MGWLPLLSFCACVSLTLWLWQRQGHEGSVVGEAEAYTFPIQTGVSGLLVLPENGEFSDRTWQLWDQVGEGELIAQLDDSLLNAEMNTIHAQIQELKAQLAAEETRVALQLKDTQQQYLQDRWRRIVQHETYILDVASLITEIAIDEAELVRRRKLLERPSKANAILPASVAGQDLVDLETQVDVYKERIDRNKRLLDGRRKLLAHAKKRRDDFEKVELELPEVSQLLLDIEEARKVQLARLDQVKEQKKLLKIYSPIRGTITEIHHRPGEQVQAGEPIVTISSDTSTHIVSYWREKNPIRPREGLEVGIRLPQPGALEYTSQIEEIGPQVVPIPPHQLRDQATQEWGTPVKIRIPPKLRLRPGELIHVLFHVAHDGAD